MGKKKGKKGKSQEPEQQPAGSQQPGTSQPQQTAQDSQQPQRGTPSHPQQSGGGDASQQQQRGPAGQPQQQQRGPPGQPQQQQQRGPPGQPQQQQQRGPPGQPQQQQQRGPPGQPQQQQQRGPPGQPQQQQQRGPPGQPQQQQQRGPPGQPQQQQQRGPPGQPQQQPQRGPQGQPQQPWGGQQQQRGPQGQPQQPWGGQQQQRGPPGEPQQERGPPGQPQQQRGPQGQPQQPWGGQQQRGPPGQPQQSPVSPQQPQAPPGFFQQPPESPPDQPQFQQGPRGQPSQRGRGRGRGQGAQRQPPQVGQQPQQQRGSPGQPQQPQAPPGQPEFQQSPRGQPAQRGQGRDRVQGPQRQPPQVGQHETTPPQQYHPQPGTSRAPSAASVSSEESMTSQVSRMQISRVEAGQGDADFVPTSTVPIKPGTMGRRIIVETNYLSLNLGKLKTAVHYDVELEPNLPKNLLRAVLEEFRMKHYPNRYPAFDGRKNLYSSTLLPFGVGPYGDDNVVVKDKLDRERKFKVTIKFANNVDLTPLQDLLKSRATPREAMQVVDIVLRSAPAVTCIPVGRSFFIRPDREYDLGEGMEMYNGFYQSAVRGWKPFLNVDVAHKAFPKPKPLLDILQEILSTYRQKVGLEELRRPLDANQERIVESYIKSLKVIYTVPNYPSSRRVYRVNGLGHPSQKASFESEGQMTTMDRYFMSKKNYKIKYPHLPTLAVGSKEHQILLPLELCQIEEGQGVNRKMTENQTSQMIKYAATSTNERKNKIVRALDQAQHNKHATIKDEFGFSIGNQFEKLEARILQPPELGYANNRQVKPARGVWNGGHFFIGVTINKWTIVCADRRPPRPDEVSGLADQIFYNAKDCGMNIASKAEQPFQTIGNTSRDIKNYFSNLNKKYDVIFVIVPNSGPQYSYVKTAAEINVGCLTQCIKLRTLGKMKSRQTAINILLKVNSKLNGTNHFLLTDPPILKRPCMIMGADVTHPSPDSRNIPSVAAVTASHDRRAFRYNICWRLQPPKVEIIEDLEAIVIEQLKYFQSQMKILPQKIIFFRDGVSEGQFDQVRHAEINAIRSACRKLRCEPAITFLVVQKRHHTRLFPTNPKDSEDRNNNVPAGTCVDTTITHPYMQDFYLVSHASIQGVAKPTKYCTLWDDSDLTNDEVEQLTYYLCHMFSRCNRSVSYPAPTYYAHLAAARAKVYIENENLNMDRLEAELNRFQIKDAIRKDLPMFFV